AQERAGGEAPEAGERADAEPGDREPDRADRHQEQRLFERFDVPGPDVLVDDAIRKWQSEHPQRRADPRDDADRERPAGEPPQQQEELLPPERRVGHDRLAAPPVARAARRARGRRTLDAEQPPRELLLDAGESADPRPQPDQDRDDERGDDQHRGGDPAGEQQPERERARHQRRAEIGEGADRAGHAAASAFSSGSQPRARGRYQLARPRIFIVAGRSTPRMIVASSSTATASPVPICLMSSEESDANSANTATITAAADVTVPAVVRIPVETA